MSTTLLPVYFGRRDRGAIVVAHALIDAGDSDLVSEFHWTLDPFDYVVRHLPRPARGHVWLHQMILGDMLAPGLVADHINRDRLDNRRENLRAVTRAQNNQNQNAYRNGSSQFRGASWAPSRNKWRATAQVDGAWHWLGYYDTEEEAGRVAAEWRAEHMEFSYEEVS